MRKKMKLSAKIARFVIFNSSKVPMGKLGVSLRRMLRSKYMPRKKTALKIPA